VVFGGFEKGEEANPPLWENSNVTTSPAIGLNDNKKATGLQETLTGKGKSKRIMTSRKRFCLALEVLAGRFATGRRVGFWQ